MKLDIQQLTTLVAIDKFGSFQAAADQLYKAKSAISYTIKQMEESLGIAIFDRSKHKATLTREGDILVKEARKILKEMAMLEKKVSCLALGWQPYFRIAYDEVFQSTIIEPLTKQFYSENILTNLELTSHTLGGCWDALLHEKADLAIGVSGMVQYRENYILQSIGTVDFQFVVSKDSPLAALDGPFDQTNLDPYTAIYVSDSSTLSAKQSYDVLTNKSTLTVSSIAMKAQMIMNNIGVGYLPTTIIEQEPYKSNLVVKDVTMKRVAAPFSVAYHKTSDSKCLEWWLKAFKPFYA